MTDIKTTEQRSHNMAAIKGKNTKPEIYLRKLLFTYGYRYRNYSKNIYGKPDIWMRKYNTAVFVNGCFWHHHKNCRYAYTPKSNIEFWNEKFEKNISRDIRVREKLREQGIKVVVIWECTLKQMKKSSEYQEMVLERIFAFLKNSDDILEI